MKTIIVLAVIYILSLQAVNAQWQQVFNSGAVVAASGNNIYAGTTSTGVHVSTNGGSNWSQTSLNNQNIYSLAASGNYIYAGGLGIFTSTNGGANWVQTSTVQTVFSLAYSNGYVFAGTSSGVYVSTNNGMNWTQSSLNNRIITALAVSGSYTYAGAEEGGGLYISTNNGANWTHNPLNSYSVISLAVDGNNVYAGLLGYGVHISTNNGQTFTSTPLSHIVYSVVYANNTLIAGTHHGGIYVYNGTNWIQRNEGLGVINVRSLCVSNGYIYAGNNPQSGAGVFRRPLTELVGIHQISSEVPIDFSLSQNYPNPFNPVTNIEFSVPKSEFVKLTVFDISGREVEILVNTNMSAGIYIADWNASKYSSGIYFYTISTKDFTQTKKMILIK